MTRNIHPQSVLLECCNLRVSLGVEMQTAVMVTARAERITRPLVLHLLPLSHAFALCV
jgi:hypothetical protein